MRFEVRAVGGEMGVMALTIDAADEADAGRQVQARGLSVLAVRAAGAGLRLPSFRRRRFPLVLFSQELLSLLEAGLSLVDALETLAAREQRPDNREVLTGIVARLHEGHPLSAALQRASDSFPPLYAAMVKASEKTGALAESLSRYIDYQTQVDRVRRQVISASIYPALLAVAGTLVILFLLGYVVPRFSQIYADTGRDLPFASTLLMRWGQLIADHGLAIGGACLAALAALGYAASRPGFRQRVVHALWRIPALGQQVHTYQLARFYRSLGMLLRGGMPVVQALQMAADLLQSALRDRLTAAAGEIREGLTISQAMHRHQLTTPVADRLLVVGERSGRMGEMMERIASFHEDESARRVENFTRLFEPLLMVFVGGVIGVVVLLMYFPIFDLAGSIQ